MDISQLRSTTTTELVGPRLQQLQTLAMGMAGVGLVLTGIGFLVNQAAFYPSWLYAYCFWLGVTTGSLALLMLHHTVGGGWGFLIRRMLEAATRLLLPMLILFAPVLLGMHVLYEWTHADEVARDPILQAKQSYLNTPFFVARTLLYFAVWGIFAYFLNKWGATQDERADPQITNRLNVMGAAGMVVYVLTVTFMTVDWLMSLTPHWFSSIYALLVVVTQGLSTLALMIVLFAYLLHDQPLVGELPNRYFRDLGNLMLALVLLWAYMSFSQYLIQFSGNLQEEVTWYVERRQGGWGLVSVFLIPLHFALPFLILLLGSNLKRNPRGLAKVGLFLVAVQLLNLFWWVAPTFRDRFSVTLSDIGAPLLIGGIWLWLWAGQMRDKTLVPAHDPRLEAHLREAIHHA